jgi:hypothetical protein
MAMRFTRVTCTECNTTFDRVPVEFDGNQGYAVLEVNPCAECGAFLCACCSTFACDGCGSTFCTSHLALVEDGTDSPLRCCTACAAEANADQLPAAIPAQRETRGTPDFCVACEQPVTMHHSRTSDVFGWWHTQCWNAVAEASAAYRSERDEAEGFTFRDLPDARPMADALVAMPRQIESTEVA